MKFGKQTTLRNRAVLSGLGVHSNAPVRMVLHPADANNGITFLRTGLPGGRDRLVTANWAHVSNTQLCTVLGQPNDATVSTVEHLMAALSGLGVDNVMVEIDGPEVPIMDGSADAFIDAIEQAGITTLSASRRYIKVLKPVRVERGRAFAELRPADRGFRLEVEIDFEQKVIGRQKKVVDLTPESFRRDLSRARTFGFVQQVEQLWKAGLALGSSLDNSIALDGDRVLNPEGLRFADEFVRHKTLDAVGDLALAGSPLVGTYRSFCGGHQMNVAVLQALFADRSAYTIVGAPARSYAVRPELGLGARPAFAPDVS